mgnify:CR=1 FL=1
MQKARLDNTYCQSNECAKRGICNRHCSHYEFDIDKNYWLMGKCEEFENEVIDNEI